MEQQRECEGLFTGKIHDGHFLGTAHSESEHERISKKWSPLLILAAASTTAGLYLSVGYNIGVVNSPADIIKIFCNESIIARYDTFLTNAELSFLWSAVVSIFLVGGTIGSLSGSWLADYLGRRGAAIVAASLFILGSAFFLVTKFLNRVELLFVGRFVVGLSAGLTTCVTPMYLIELAPLYLRGAMGVFCQLGITFGVLVAQVLSLRQLLGTEELWPYLLSCCGIFPIIFILLATVLPESPKYLLFINKRHDAIAQLTRIRGGSNVVAEREIVEMEVAMQAANEQVTESWSLIKVITDRSLFLPLVLVCAMQGGQQLSGINAVFYYSTLIFKNAGLSEQNGQFATIGAGIVNLLMSFVSIEIMSRFKRRSVMQISCISSIICLLILFLSIDYMDNASWIPYICIAAVLAYVLCYGIGLGPIPFFVGSELFEVGPRPSAMALGSMANWGANFVVGLTFPLMQQGIGSWSFLVFAVFILALLLLVRFYLPETKGRDPSEIALLCNRGLRSKVLESPADSTTTAETVPISDLKV
ncbi:hypothetical protein FQA39_LY17237 [Lamprigera yunnana]|nr:hypothetical protein FQA39_LY17237 [Lamprigera yunnana]